VQMIDKDTERRLFERLARMKLRPAGFHDTETYLAETAK
jgi:hypothetical protein